jgi:hypothetical protein
LITCCKTKSSTIANLVFFQKNLWSFNSSRACLIGQMLMKPKKQLHVIYLDLSKAFDMVNHSILIAKLGQLGFPTPFLDFFRSYLSGRSQTVSIEGCCSDSYSVEKGVPQGSVLGPLLFVLFINDLPKVVQHSTIKLFADDIKLYRRITCAKDAELLQNDLDRVVNWIEQSGLQLSASKSALLKIGSKYPTNSGPISYSIQGSTIAEVQVFRDLGVLVDSDLSFADHVSQICGKATRSASCIPRAFTYKEPKFLASLYSTYARPHVEFASVVWSPTKVGLARDIERVQRRFTKYLPSLADHSYSARCSRLCLRSLLVRRSILDLVFIYKLIHGRFLHVQPQDYIQLDSSSALRRKHEYHIVKESCTSTPRRSFLVTRVTDLWNKLDPIIVNSHTIPEFRKRLEGVLPLIESHLAACGLLHITE